MVGKSELLGVLGAHAESIRLVSVLRMLARKSDLLKSFNDAIGDDAAISPGADRSIQLLKSVDRLIHTADQLYLMAVRSAISESMELTRDYCRKTEQVQKLKGKPWFQVIRILRNALNHNFIIEFKTEDRVMLPLRWGVISIDASMENQELSLEVLPIAAALEWLESLEDFVANELT